MEFLKELINTTLPFHYGKINELKEYEVNHGDELAAICIEAQRGNEININFINEVIKIGKKNNAVIIFDEISSGFRLATGGLVYKNYKLEPDMVLLGKALGNGYGITAVMGKKSVKNCAQNSFISSSYWSERTGYVAALETISIFEEDNVIDSLKNSAGYLRKKLTRLFEELELKIFVDGLHTVPNLLLKRIMH